MAIGSALHFKRLVRYMKATAGRQSSGKFARVQITDLGEEERKCEATSFKCGFHKRDYPAVLVKSGLL